MAIVDLNQLAAPDVVEVLDYETILAERKATLVSLYPEEQQEAVARTLTLESEPIVKLLEENAYREVIWRQRVNEAARAVMLAYAEDADLDQIGGNYNVERLVITPADDTTFPPTPAVMESNTDYRLRIQQAFEGLSTAGSTGAYQFHGRSADGRVADISVISPEPACVTVSVLSRENNGVASDELLAIVRDALPHIDQAQESDAVFLSRLADRNGASVSVKAGKLLFLKAGTGRTASGKPIPQMTIERGDGDRHQFAIADREAYTGVTAKWLHTKDPKPQKQKVKLKRKPKAQHLRALQHPKATKTTSKARAKKEQEAREGEYMVGESENVLELTTIYATKAQAMRAAQAKWDKLQRGVAEFSISLAIGRADLFPETPIAVKGFKRVIDEQSWIISRVVHNLNGNGYTTGLELEVKVSDVEYVTEEMNK